MYVGVYRLRGVDGLSVVRVKPEVPHPPGLAGFAAPLFPARAQLYGPWWGATGGHERRMSCALSCAVWT